MVPDRDTTRQAILRAASEEFSELGFSGASLRGIAARAGVTTGPVYWHHKDKNALFGALVGRVADETRALLLHADETNRRSAAAVGQLETAQLQREALYAYLDHLYENHDAYFLLLCRASGSTYENWADEIAGLYAGQNMAYIGLLLEKGICGHSPTRHSVHALTRAYIMAVFGVITGGIARQDAHAYADDLVRFFDAGWKSLLGL